MPYRRADPVSLVPAKVAWCIAALACAPGMATPPVAPPTAGKPAAAKPAELTRQRVPANLLKPIPAKGGVPPMVPARKERFDPAIVRGFEAQFRALRSRSFTTQHAPTRTAGIEQLRAFTDPASFEPMWLVLGQEKDDVRLAVLDHYARQGEPGQAALAWVAIRGKSKEIRAEATRRVQRPPTESVLAVLDEALRSTEHEVVNNAGLLAGAVHAIEALPALIFAQFAQDTAATEGDLAWIAIGTTRSYVANVIPVTGDNSGAFQPVIGQVYEGVVMRVRDCVATTYRADVHNSLVSMSSFDTGTDTARLDWNMRAWWEWFNTEYVPFKQREDQELARRQAAEAGPTGDGRSDATKRDAAP